MNIRGVIFRHLKGTGQLEAPLNLATPRGHSSPIVRQFFDLARRTAKDFLRD